MQAVILAGGLGTRLKPFTDNAPKPMFPINGKPYLEYLLIQIREFGITEVIMLLGYMPDCITDYFGNGDDFGVHIVYSISDISHDTGRRLYLAKELIQDDFLLMYCDNYCPIEFEKMVSEFYARDAKIQITVYNNKDSYTKSNLITDSLGCVLHYDKKRVAENLEGVDIGYVLIKREVLDMLTDDNLNFEGYLYPQLALQKKLYANRTEHRYYSIGSYERIELTKEFFSAPPIVFLDRDGTINQKAPMAQYITNYKEFVWIAGAKEAIKLLNDNGYKVFIITNQPGIARGCMTYQDLDRIHEMLLLDLAAIGAKIDKIYMCTHNWDDGCECRKPGTKMLFDAQKEYNFNMKTAIFYGDDDRDIQAAKNANCKGIKITESHTLLHAVKALIGQN